jgi:hypothetical protein
LRINSLAVLLSLCSQATIIAAVALGVAATGFVGRRLLIKYVRPGGLKVCENGALRLIESPKSCNLT